MALSMVPQLVPHLDAGTGYHCDLSLSAGRDRMRRAFVCLVRGRGAAGVAKDPDKLLERANSGSRASIALPSDARAIVGRGLSPQSLDQAAKPCHVSPHARDR
jgi:hypothetical protein